MLTSNHESWIGIENRCTNIYIYIYILVGYITILYSNKNSCAAGI